MGSSNLLFCRDPVVRSGPVPLAPTSVMLVIVGPAIRESRQDWPFIAD
jgi:hypothetical protein